MAYLHMNEISIVGQKKDYVRKNKIKRTKRFMRVI